MPGQSGHYPLEPASYCQQIGNISVIARFGLITGPAGFGNPAEVFLICS